MEKEDLTVLNNFSSVNAQLYRCAQPDESGLRDLKRFGIDTIIKLSAEDEFPLKKEIAGFGENIVIGKIELFHPDEKEVKRIILVIKDLISKGRSVCVHCLLGRDRTGFVIASWRKLVDGWSVEDALKEWRCFGNDLLINVVDERLISCLKRLK